MLQEYHNTLCETLTALGYSQKLITLEELHAEYESKAVLGMVYACAFLPIIMCESDSGFDLDNSLQDGVSHTAIYSGKKIKSALQRMLPLFEKQGVFRQLN
jgi:hypothetical protein